MLDQAAAAVFPDLQKRLKTKASGLKSIEKPWETQCETHRQGTHREQNVDLLGFVKRPWCCNMLHRTRPWEQRSFTYSRGTHTMDCFPMCSTMFHWCFTFPQICHTLICFAHMFHHFSCRCEFLESQRCPAPCGPFPQHSADSAGLGMAMLKHASSYCTASRGQWFVWMTNLRRLASPRQQLPTEAQPLQNSSD